MKKYIVWIIWIGLSLALGFVAYGCSGLSVFENHVYGMSTKSYLGEYLVRIVVYLIVLVGNIILMRILNKNGDNRMELLIQLFVGVFNMKWVAFGSTLLYRHIEDLIEKGEFYSYSLMTLYILGVVAFAYYSNNMMIKKGEKIGKKAVALGMCLIVFGGNVFTTQASERKNDGVIIESSEVDCEVDDVNAEIQEYIDENFEEGGELIKSVKESKAYEDLVENGQVDEAKKIKKFIKNKAYKEISFVIKVEEQFGMDNSLDVMSEEEALKEIEENETAESEIISNSYTLKKCTYKAGKMYTKKSSDGYMRLIISSYAKNNKKTKWGMAITYHWLKNPTMRFEDGLTFFHDSNITLNTESVDFTAYREWTVKASGEKLTHKYRYKKGIKLGKNESKAKFDSDTQSISMSFGIGPTQGLLKLIKNEAISGAVTFNISKANKNTLAANIGFAYIHTTFDINTNIAKAIKWTSNGKVDVSGFNSVTKYKYYDEFKF